MTRTPLSRSKGRRSRSQGAGAYCGGLPHSLLASEIKLSSRSQNHTRTADNNIFSEMAELCQRQLITNICKCVPVLDLKNMRSHHFLTSCAGGRHNMPPPPVTLTFDLLTLEVVSKSRVTWSTSVPILVFLGLCSRLRPDVRDRRTDRRQTSDSILV